MRNRDNEDRARLLLIDIQENGRGLTEWEKDFIESMEEWLDEGKYVTERQLDVLERIYDEKV